MERIMVVEDDRYMREELTMILKEAGYEVCFITEFDAAVSIILEQKPDLILLDLNLPGTSGFEICKQLREKSNVLVLVLTGRNNTKDELHVLNLGADEYLEKPCRKEQLLVRIKNLLKRNTDQKYILEIGEIQFDIRTYTLYFNEQFVKLGENQGKIFEVLLNNHPKFVSGEKLMMKLWGTIDYIDENALQVNLTRLRKTFEKENVPCFICTKRKEGYYLNMFKEHV